MPLPTFPPTGDDQLDALISEARSRLAGHTAVAGRDQLLRQLAADWRARGVPKGYIDHVYRLFYELYVLS